MIIETKNLTKQYNGRGGFKNVSLSVEKGEVFSFLGKNGAGKSTFIKTLLGIVHPTSGEAFLFGKPLDNIEVRRNIGYLPELFNYHSYLSGYEVLFSHALLYKMNKSDIKTRIEQVLHIVGLKNHEHKKIKYYSKGMKQRIGLGCAILNNCNLLFLDEPTSALDPVGRKQVRDIIMRLKDDGKTIFINTHLLSEAELISDKIAILDKGNLKKVGTISDITKSPLIVCAKNLNEFIVTKLKLFDNNLRINGEIISMFVDDEDIPNIANIIVSNGAYLYCLKKKENMLEEAFINTVGQDDVR